MIKILAFITLTLTMYHLFAVFKGNLASLVFEKIHSRTPLPEETTITIVACIIVVLESIALIWSILYMIIFARILWLSVILFILAVYHVFGDKISIKIDDKLVAMYSVIAYTATFILIIG